MTTDRSTPTLSFDRSPPAPGFVVLTVLGVLLLYFWRFGYDYAISDQSEIIPYLLHWLDPALLENDWFVQTQSSGFSVRDYTVALLVGVSQMVPVWLAVALAYLGSWIAIAWGSYRIAFEVTKTELAAGLAVLLVLVFTPRWTLGGNDLVTRMFTPSMLGWALALPAVYWTMHAKWIPAGALLGAAAWFQPLVGLLTALVLIGALLAKRPLQPAWHQLKPAVFLGGAFVLVALPTIVPLVLRQFGPSSTLPTDLPSLFYLMAEFRNPHHYLPTHFPTRSYVHFGLLAAAGTAGFAYLHRRGRLHHGRLLTPLLFSIGLLTLIGVAGTTAVPVLFVAKLQLFKLTVLAKLIFIIGAAGAAVDLSRNIWSRLPLQEVLFRWTTLGVLLLAWLATVYGIYTQPAVADRLMRPWAHQQRSLGQIEQWARTATDRTALFAVPPSISSFRSNARRPVVVTFKAFPFEDDNIVEWWERLTTLAPITDPNAGGAAALSLLDTAYHRHTDLEWLHIAKKYGIDFILVDRRQQRPSLSFPAEQSRDRWTLYRLPEQ